MAEQTKAHRGWVDLLLASADLGIAAPPVPQAHRRLLKKQADLFWSTRDDLDLWSMYNPDQMREDIVRQDQGDFSALSFLGRGWNSYAWNLQIVTRPFAVMTQCTWGGGFDFDPVKNDTDLTHAFRVGFEPCSGWRTTARWVISRLLHLLGSLRPRYPAL